MPSSHTSSTSRPTVRDAFLRLMREFGLDTVFGAHAGSSGRHPGADAAAAVPESLSKGVVDGAAVPWEGTPSIKVAEIAKYHLDVPAGAPRISNTIFLFAMNQARYDGLAPEFKRVIDANSGLATSAWAGETGFDAVVETYKKQYSR